MGIRYYAYPIDSEFVAPARTSPRLFIGDDPLMDAWGPAEGRPAMLYLDKCWRDLQQLFEPQGVDEPRPALALVEGKVIMHHDGWEACARVLDATQVADIAHDIALVDEGDVRGMLERTGGVYPHDGFEGELAYVMHYLVDAQHFTARLAEEGRAIVYLIG